MKHFFKTGSLVVSGVEFSDTKEVLARANVGYTHETIRELLIPFEDQKILPATVNLWLPFGPGENLHGHLLDGAILEEIGSGFPFHPVHFLAMLLGQAKREKGPLEVCGFSNVTFFNHPQKGLCRAWAVWDAVDCRPPGWRFFAFPLEKENQYIIDTQNVVVSY